MDDAELEVYNLQLEQVSSALAKDPSNQDLLNLKAELENLISLTASLAAQPSAATRAAPAAAQNGASSSKSTLDREERDKPEFRVGQQVLAKFSQDGKFYPALVEAVSAERYTVRYTGYGNSETLPSTHLRPHTTTDHPPPPPTPPTTSTPPPPSSLPPPPPPPTDDRAIRKHRNDKKLLRREHKSQLQTQKAADWQKFASKATRNKTLKKSIFGTSDDPYAKVGVTKAAGSRAAKEGDRSE